MVFSIRKVLRIPFNILKVYHMKVQVAYSALLLKAEPRPKEQLKEKFLVL